MERKTLDKIINFLREQAVGGSPTMSVGNVGYTSKGGQTRAGFDPVMGKGERRKKPRYIWTRGIRKNWKKKDESK